MGIIETVVVLGTLVELVFVGLGGLGGFGSGGNGEAMVGETDSESASTTEMRAKSEVRVFIALIIFGPCG